MKNAFTRVLLTVVLAVNSIVAQQNGQVPPASSDTIRPPEALVLQNVAPVPRALADEVNRYTNSRAASLTSWHPTRREMLISTRFAETYQVHRVRMPGGDRTQLTFFSEQAAGGSYQPTTGDYFIFNKDSGTGADSSQLYRYDFATGNVTLLTSGLSSNSSPVWSQTGDRIAYMSMRRNGRDTDIYVIDPLNPQSDRLLAQMDRDYWWPLNWSPDGRKILCFQYISGVEMNLWIVDSMTGEKTLFTPQDQAEKIAYWRGQFSRDGRSLYLTCNRDSEFQRLAYVDLATKQFTFLTDHIQWDVGSFHLSPDGNTLAFITNEDGVGRLRLLDTRTRRERPVPALPVGIVSGVRWHRNGRDLGFILESARYPQDVYSLDIETGRVERWTYSETGGINTDNFSEAELMRWPSFDGRMISGFLYRPASTARFTGRRPVVIDIHGGPPMQSRPSYNGRNNYLLNELGVVMIYPNVRGSGGYGKTFSSLDNGIRREDSIRDFGALLDWIKTRPDLDSDRVMVQGGSYGGFAALAVAANYNDRIRAVLSEAGISSLTTMAQAAGSSELEFQRIEYGDERDPRVREFWERISPLNNAQRIRCPLFVVHGRNDSRSRVGEAEQIVAAVRQNGTPVWYLLANDEGHGFARKANRDFLFYTTVLFMRQYLLN